MATTKGICFGDNGNCGRRVHVRGLCRAHYERDLKGMDIHTALRPRDGSMEVQVVPPRVTPQVKRAIQAACEQMGVSEYEFVRRLIMQWYESYERLMPAPPKGKNGG